MRSLAKISLFYLRESNVSWNTPARMLGAAAEKMGWSILNVVMLRTYELILFMY